MASTKKSAPKPAGPPHFIGLWFHAAAPDDSGEHWQGQIIGKENGYYLVQLYAPHGTETTIRIMTAGEMLSWNFYSNNKKMVAAYHEAEGRRAQQPEEKPS